MVLRELRALFLDDRDAGPEVRVLVGLVLLLNGLDRLGLDTAWAGSYTPQGRSQWALTFTLGANRRESMELSFLVIVFSGGTLLRE